MKRNFGVKTVDGCKIQDVKNLEFSNTKDTKVDNEKRSKVVFEASGTNKEVEEVTDSEIISTLQEFFDSDGTLTGLPVNDWSMPWDIDVLPLITVGDVILSYPCNELVCRQLVERCKPAPFGLGSETVVDKQIRNSWEADPSQVSINSSAWLRLFENSKTSWFLEEVRKRLGPQCRSISATFHKLLVYEPGSFFKSHRDTQRDCHHFGTIVVFLPSIYTGGELVLNHLNKERSYSFSYSNDDLKNDLLKCRTVSFFTDVEHEVKKLESGCRVALTYNLFFDGQTQPILPLPCTEVESKVRKVLHRAFSLPLLKDKKIGVLLKHSYTMVSLNADLLKGLDKALFDAVNSSRDFSLDLMPVDVNAEGSAGDDEAVDDALTYYKECIKEHYPVDIKIWRRSFLSLENEVKMSSPGNSSEVSSDEVSDEEDGDVLRFFTLFPWDSNYKSCKTFGDVYFIHDWSKVPVDKICLSKAHPTGNEGAEFELQYHAAALIIKPNHHK